MIMTTISRFSRINLGFEEDWQLMNEAEQLRAIQQPTFFGEIRNRVKAILEADFEYDGFLRFSLGGVPVQFRQENDDAHLFVGHKDGTTDPIYEWVVPITWLGVRIRADVN
jgi:hypothetical protein